MRKRGSPATLSNILVLGHDGFIGRHIMEQLAATRPGTRIVGRSYPQTDLTRPQDVMALAKLFDADTAVIMCSGIKKQHGDNLETFSKNVSMAVNVSALLEKRPVGRFIFFSTADVYGEETHNTAITEEAPARPTSYYGMAKHVSEWLFQKTFARPGSGSLIILRMPFVYGPGDQARIYGPLGFIRAALEGDPITLWGDGRELREFLFVRDLAWVVDRLVSQEFQGVLNVATGQSHTFREVVDDISKLSPRKLSVDSRPRTKSKVDNVYDITRLLKLLPDLTFTPLEDGIRLTWEAASNENQAV